MRSLFRAALLTAAATVPFAAQAQTATGGNPTTSTEPTGSTADPAANAGGTGDVVVTARKTAERLQDVPLAITAFNAQELQSARVTSLADIAKLTPGLNYTPLFGRQNQLPIIRGAAQTLGQLNVGVFLDGIYLSGKGGVDLEVNDLERVEVVRGPQSALYGRNTFAGAINYVTKRPTATLSGSGLAEVGEDGLLRFRASLSGPITDTIRVRVGGYYREFDGFYRSSIDGGRVDFEQSYGGIGTIEWQPTQNFTLTLRASYSKDDNGQPPSSVILTNAGLGTPAGGSATQQRNLIFIGEVPAIPENGVTVNTGTFSGLPGITYGDREETARGSATIEHDFGGALLTSISAYAKRNAQYTFDGDNTICNVAATGSTGCPNFGFPFAAAIPLGSSAIALSSNKGFLRDVSQELRLQSHRGGPIDWLVGAYYYDNINFGIDRGLSPLTTSGATAYSGFNGNYAFPQTRLTTKSFALFGSLTWHATSQLEISGELRHETERQTFAQRPTYVTSAARSTLVFAAPTAAQALALAQYDAAIAAGAVPSPVATSATVPFTGSYTIFPTPDGVSGPLAATGAAPFTATRQQFNFVTPRVIVSYHITPDIMFYSSYARGTKTGGFNTGLNVFANQRTYQPESSNNFEVGFKSDFMDHRLRFNAAGYAIEWNNQQATCQNPVSAGGSSTNRSYLCNVAASTIYGIETDAVARFSDFFTLSANYTYTHARYDRFVDDSLAQALILAGLPAINFAGKHLPYVPDHKLVVTPRFDFRVGGDATIEARADVQYQSRTYLRADNLQNFGDKTVVDLRLTGRVSNFTAQVFVNNVFDDDRPVAGVRFFDSVNYSVSAPLITGASRRLIGGSIGYSF